MSLRINFNSASQIASRALSNTQDAMSGATKRLATGLRVNGAGDDAAGMAVSQRLLNQARGNSGAARNARDAVSLAQTADGALAETHNLLARLRELAVYAANDTLTASDRATIQTEADALLSEIDRIAASTQFNNVALLDKNSLVSLHNGGSGLTIQIGSDPSLSSNSLRMTVAAARLRDLGDVATLSGLDGSLVTGTQTFSVDTVTGIKYDAAVDTIFDLRDSINAAGAGITATVTSGKLKLNSGSSAKGLGSDTGAVFGILFSANSPTTARQQAQSSTTVGEVGVSTSGTLTLGVTVAAGSGGAADTASMGEVGITSAGTMRVTASVTTTASATDQRTVGEVGSTSGVMAIEIYDVSGQNAAPMISVSYSADETLAAVAARIAGLLNDYEWAPVGGTGDGGFPATVDFGSSVAGAMSINLRPSGSANTDIFKLTDVSGTLASRLGLNSTTKATSQASTNIQTISQSEYVDVNYSTSDTLEQVRARLETALQSIDVVEYSSIGNMFGASVTVASGTFTVNTNDSNVSLSFSGAPAALGLSSSASTVTGSQLDTVQQSETVTVAYSSSDTLGGVAARIQSSLRAAGAIGYSTTSTSAGAAADFGISTAGKLSIDLADPALTAVIATVSDSGGLAVALNLAASPNSAQAASTSSVIESDFTLVSASYSAGTTSLESISLTSQAGASAAISLLDAAVTQVSQARASLGAMQSRLYSASSSLAVATENAMAANSRIADADVAEELARLVRAEIVQRAGLSVLAQSNQAPLLVLRLLRN